MPHNPLKIGHLAIWGRARAGWRPLNPLKIMQSTVFITLCIIVNGLCSIHVHSDHRLTWDCVTFLFTSCKIHMDYM